MVTVDPEMVIVGAAVCTPEEVKEETPEADDSLKMAFALIRVVAVNWMGEV